MRDSTPDEDTRAATVVETVVRLAEVARRIADTVAGLIRQVEHDNVHLADIQLGYEAAIAEVRDRIVALSDEIAELKRDINGDY